jgi:hypothetical protein
LKNIISDSINKYDLVTKKLTNAYFVLHSHSNQVNQIREDLKLIGLEKEMNIISKDCNFIKDAQRSFNKYVKYQVNKQFGTSVLIFKQIRALDRNIMRKIKGEVFLVKIFLPNNNFN